MKAVIFDLDENIAANKLDAVYKSDGVFIEESPLGSVVDADPKIIEELNLVPISAAEIITEEVE